MTETRFTSTLTTTADEPKCQSYARVPIRIDTEGATASGCPRHAVAALDGIADTSALGQIPRDLTSGNAKPLSCLRNEANSSQLSVCASRFSDI